MQDNQFNNSNNNDQTNQRKKFYTKRNKNYEGQGDDKQFSHNSRFQKNDGNRQHQKPRFNNSMSEKLGQMRDNNQIDYIRRPPALMRAVTSWEGDSIDHINVQHDAVTPIGRFLAQNSNFSFRHSHFGDFTSVDTFYIWLTTVERDDRLRTCSASEAYNFKNRLTHRSVHNLYAILLDADYQKLKQYPETLAAFKESTLPFDNYFYDHNTELKLPRRSVRGTWKIEGWEEIRKAVKEGREPDFKRWYTVPGSGLYDFVLSEDGTKKTGPKIVERIPMPKEFRNNIYNMKNVHSGNSPKGHSGVVHLNKASETVDLNKNPGLKSRVHTVQLDVKEDTKVGQEMTDVDNLPKVSIEEVTVESTAGATIDATSETFIQENVSMTQNSQAATNQEAITSNDSNVVVKDIASLAGTSDHADAPKELATDTASSEPIADKITEAIGKSDVPETSLANALKAAVSKTAATE